MKRRLLLSHCTIGTVALAICLLLGATSARAAQLLSVTPTAAVSAQLSAVQQFKAGAAAVKSASVLCSFTYGSGGTTADAWVQTSIDGGTNWIDVANCHFTTSSLKQYYNLSSLTPVTTVYTPTDGTLTASTSKDGILGTQWRVKYTTVGTYAGTTLQVFLGPGGMQQ